MKKLLTYGLLLLSLTACSSQGNNESNINEKHHDFVSAICKNDPDLKDAEYYAVKPEFQEQTKQLMKNDKGFYGLIKIGESYAPLNEDGVFTSMGIRFEKPDVSQLDKIENCEGV